MKLKKSLESVLANSSTSSTKYGEKKHNNVLIKIKTYERNHKMRKNTNVSNICLAIPRFARVTSNYCGLVRARSSHLRVSHSARTRSHTITSCPVAKEAES